jgi:hypothetical protein
LRDEFAAEGFGEEGLRKLVHVSLRLGVAGFDLVGEGEQLVHAADDFALLGKWRTREWERLDFRR